MEGYKIQKGCWNCEHLLQIQEEEASFKIVYYCNERKDLPFQPKNPEFKFRPEAIEWKSKKIVELVGKCKKWKEAAKTSHLAAHAALLGLSWLELITSYHEKKNGLISFSSKEKDVLINILSSITGTPKKRERLTYKNWSFLIVPKKLLHEEVSFRLIEDEWLKEEDSLEYLQSITGCNSKKAKEMAQALIDKRMTEEVMSPKNRAIETPHAIIYIEENQ